MHVERLVGGAQMTGSPSTLTGLLCAMITMRGA